MAKPNIEPSLNLLLNRFCWHSVSTSSSTHSAVRFTARSHAMLAGLANDDDDDKMDRHSPIFWLFWVQQCIRVAFMRSIESADSGLNDQPKRRKRIIDQTISITGRLWLLLVDYLGILSCGARLSISIIEPSQTKEYPRLQISTKLNFNRTHKSACLSN